MIKVFSDNFKVPLMLKHMRDFNHYNFVLFSKLKFAFYVIAGVKASIP